MIDLRSDTVTKPTPAMLEAMMHARVGDDVFDEDPTVIALEEKAAKLFGKEAALFCASGTMCNQLGLKINTQPLDDIICDRDSHVFRYEAAGYAFHSNCSVTLVNGNNGIISADDVLNNIHPDNVHYPTTRLVVLENTHNKGGGSYYSLQTIKEISEASCKNNLMLHLDGARIFNAMEETKDKPEEIGKHFDSISFCLSKGLGAPVGSLLLSSKEKIKQAKRFRKAFGGGWRQAGFLAAAGIYALDNNINRLKEDHRRARQLEKVIAVLPYVGSVLPVLTNILVFTLKDEHDSNSFLEYLLNHNIKAVPFGKNTIRFVTHLDITDDMIEKTSLVLNNYNGE
jgi:threonine aldolase